MQTRYTDALNFYKNGDHSAALQLCSQILTDRRSASQECGSALFLTGLIHKDRNEFVLAEHCMHRAVLRNPESPAYWLNLGIVYHLHGLLSEAEACYHNVLKLKPDSADACNNIGKALTDQGRPGQAIPWYEKAINMSAGYHSAYFNMGISYNAMGDTRAAAACYRKCIEIKPDFLEAWNNLAIVYQTQHDHGQAIVCYQKLLELNPDYGEAYNNLGTLYTDMGNLEEAIACFKKSSLFFPGNASIVSNLTDQLFYACDWKEGIHYRSILDTLTDQALADGTPPAENPFSSLKYHDDPARCLRIASAYSASIAMGKSAACDPQARAHTRGNGSGSGKIRIGYLSNDFKDHAVSHILWKVFEIHNRDEFSVYVYSHGPSDNSIFRRTIEAQCDEFVDITGLSDDEAAGRIRKDVINILVDLKGYTHSHRLGIFARRPAPVQISYLGFLGTTGASFIDYFVADPVVVPPDHACHYSESLAYLPCYQVADYSDVVATRSWSRLDAGLPEDGVVFCSFNQPYKFEPVLFDVWMRILKAVPGSTLWLRFTSAIARKNLMSEAQARGVNPARLVFSDKVGLGDHLARLKLADIALDTRIYNGGATTSNALWAGVPVVTLRGRQFVARMSSSSLHAIGLDSLIATSLEEYERICIELAGDRERLNIIKNHILSNRRASILFDMPRFVGDLEALYRQMWGRFGAGNSPEQICISHRG